MSWAIVPSIGMLCTPGKAFEGRAHAVHDGLPFAAGYQKKAGRPVRAHCSCLVRTDGKSGLQGLPDQLYVGTHGLFVISGRNRHRS